MPYMLSAFLQSARGNLVQSLSGVRLAAHGVFNWGFSVPSKVSGRNFGIVSLMTTNWTWQSFHQELRCFRIPELEGLFLLLGEGGLGRLDWHLTVPRVTNLLQVRGLHPKDAWKPVPQPGVRDSSEAGWCPPYRFFKWRLHDTGK